MLATASKADDDFRDNRLIGPPGRPSSAPIVAMEPDAAAPDTGENRTPSTAGWGWRTASRTAAPT